MAYDAVLFSSDETAVRPHCTDPILFPLDFPHSCFGRSVGQPNQSPGAPWPSVALVAFEAIRDVTNSEWPRPQSGWAAADE